MRTLSSSFFMSLDGVVDSPHDWHFPYVEEQMMAVVGETLASADALLLGRRTYEEWAASWPGRSSDGGMADYMNNTRKYVASASLETLEWQNSTLLEGDVPAAVAELKRRPGRDISIPGSGTLVRSLLQAGLIDELRLLVHPILVGSGKRLFEHGGEPRGLELADSRTLETGVLSLTYRPAG
jgi:dihydrofolate reductase